MHIFVCIGADPDNVSHDDKEKILLHPLKTQEVPEAKVYEGNIKDLLTSHESVELSNVLLNKTQVCSAMKLFINK